MVLAGVAVTMLGPLFLVSLVGASSELLEDGLPLCWIGAPALLASGLALALGVRGALMAVFLSEGLAIAGPWTWVARQKGSLHGGEFPMMLEIPLAFAGLFLMAIGWLWGRWRNAGPGA